MTLILADVGGTNVRFAVARNGAIDLGSIRRFENDRYPSFDAVLKSFLDGADAGPVTALSFAVAGPVTGRTARLTNRDWTLDVSDLSRANGGARVSLLNDLSALGYALDSLGEDGLLSVMSGPDGEAPRQVQRLVVGVGTGFNVSPVVSDRGVVVCQRAEAGLASLPSRVMNVLEAFLGRPAPWAHCVEELLSGRGLSRLHAEATNAPAIGGREVIERATSGEADARASLDAFAHALGEMVQDLRLNFMPSGGIYLAGSVVRSLLDSPSAPVFEARLKLQPTVKSTIPAVAVSLITQDEAALLGCLAYAHAEGSD